VGLALVPAPAAAQADLPLGGVEAGRIAGDTPADYRFAVDTAGILSIAVQGTGDDDLTLEVVDGDGQRVRNGYADDDLRGSYGTEQLSVTLPEAGTYLVRVAPGAAGVELGDFDLGASWLPFPGFAVPDPDGRPSGARLVAVGENVEDSLDAADGDQRDWFVVESQAAGVLTLVLRGTSGEPDLVLEAYTGASFAEDDAAARSDQDQEGVLANESVSVDVVPGARVYVKVLGLFDGVTGGYRLSSGLIP
jgi:hypothetical protein